MRNYLLPVLLAAAIGGPILYSRVKSSANLNHSDPFGQTTNGYASQTVFGQPTQNSFTQAPFSPAPTSPFIQASAPIAGSSQPFPAAPTGFISGVDLSQLPNNVILPGTAYGPDLTATPLEFLPTTNIGEIFRFDIDPNWVKGRWDRVSTSPSEAGLHGMRVALVTGVNRNDLHGSLTYQFDANQRVQRIKFQGWTGDTQPLIQFLSTGFGFQSQPTHLAGLYVGGNRRTQTGALILKHPDVVRDSNPNQQVAVVMEIDNPEGQFGMSRDMQELLLSASRR